MRKFIWALLLLSGTAFAGSATVSWQLPTTNTDGSTIPASGEGALVSSRVEYGTCTSLVLNGTLTSLVVGVPATSVEITGLTAGEWCFGVYAKNAYGSESARSALASKVVPAANTAPVLTQPANQSTVRGVAVNLQLAASDANGDALTYSATGVPTGITLNSAGLFSGSPTTVGNYTVVATVSDTGGLTNSKTFTWEVKNAPVPNPPTIVTVTTVAYELNKRGGVGSAVGYVALNTPCLGTAPLISKSGKTYYEVSLADVELSKMPKSVIVVGVCAAV